MRAARSHLSAQPERRDSALAVGLLASQNQLWDVRAGASAESARSFANPSIPGAVRCRVA
jgi:hypothetical protein